LDKQIRLLTQQTVVLKNLGKQKRGIFALPKVFCWSSYYKVPTAMDKPLSYGTFRLHLDRGLQECFETAAGVGMAGMRADRDEKTKGVSWLWFFALAALFCFGLVKVPMLLARGVASVTMGSAKAAAASYKITVITNGAPARADLFTGTNSERKVVLPTTQQSIPATLQPAQVPEPEKSKEVYLAGFALVGGRATVFLTDGRQYTTDDRELEFIGKQFVVIQGKRYGFAPPDIEARKRESSKIQTVTLSDFASKYLR
jgi:hypothetical protein